MFLCYFFWISDLAYGNSDSSSRLADVKILYSSWITELDQHLRLILEPIPEVTTDLINRTGGGPFSRELAAYLPVLNVISVSPSASLNAAALRRIVFHELGHAFVLNHLSPTALCNWAKAASPWRSQSLDCESVRSHYDPVLRAPHPLVSAPASFLDSSAEIPSRYSMESIHEYFAESFCNWLEHGEAAGRINGILAGRYETRPVAMAGEHGTP